MLVTWRVSRKARFDVYSFAQLLKPPTSPSDSAKMQYSPDEWTMMSFGRSQTSEYAAMFTDKK